MKETKLVCPKCGAEIAIPEHESLTIGVTIAKNSGLGTVTLPLASEQKTKQVTSSSMIASKKIAAMKAAGINVDNLFAITNAEGVEAIGRFENGHMSILSDDDATIASIFNHGTVPNRRLFRRWIMSQVFHMLSTDGGFLDALQNKGYCYSWEMLIEELRVQSKMELRDAENFTQRNRWFNKDVAFNMAEDYIEKLGGHVSEKLGHTKKCKGVPYITLKGKHIFCADLDKKVCLPLEQYQDMMKNADTVQELLGYVTAFYHYVKMYYAPYELQMSAAFKDAYKGAGGYFTMRNLIMFHGCHMFSRNNNPLCETSSLCELDKMAESYKNGEGWRMFGAMKELIRQNNIDIEAKMAEWRK